MLWVKNGSVLTMDGASPLVENFLIKNGVIEGIDLTEAKGAASGAEVLDLQGAAVLPGFHDSHLHLVDGGMDMLQWVDLSGVRSITEIQQRLGSHIRQRNLSEQEWVMGYVWNHEALAEGRMPTREELDQVSRRHGIYLKRACVHLAAVNSRLEEMTGTVSRNGLIFDQEIPSLLEKKPVLSQEQLERLIEETCRCFAQAGLITVQSDDLRTFPDYQSKRRILEAYDALRRQGRLAVRVHQQMQVRSLAELKQTVTLLDQLNITQDEWFSCPVVKVILDGTIGGWTAAVNRPYKDKPREMGGLAFSDEECYQIMEYSYQKGFQLAAHAIGGRALSQFIEAAERLRGKCGEDLLKQRLRVVHCQLTDPWHMEKLGKLGVTADIQPAFVGSDYKLVHERFHTKDCETFYSWKSLMEHGVTLSGSSDFPIEPYKPLDGVRCAVTRTDREGSPEGGFMPQEKLTVTEALELYTKGAARTLPQETAGGMIKKGFRADFTVLAQNPCLVEPEEIGNIEVLFTYIDGKRVKTNRE